MQHLLIILLSLVAIIGAIAIYPTSAYLLTAGTPPELTAALLISGYLSLIAGCVVCLNTIEE